MGKYRLTLRCKECGYKYKRIVDDLDVPDPSCPHCLKVQPPDRGFDPQGKPVAYNNSNVTKAIDTTAQIVMEDYGLTDLKSDARPGETMAPKLAPRLQQQVDNFFTRGGGAGRKAQFQGKVAAQRAMSGALRAGTPDVVGMMHERKAKPPINVIASTDGIIGKQ